MTTSVKQLWASQDPRVWQALHAQHDRAVSNKHTDASKSKKLQELQQWYERLSTDVQARNPPHLILEELVKLVEWKLLRDKWRPRLVQLAQSNTNKQQVKDSTAQAVASLMTACDATPAQQLQGLGEAIDILADAKRKTKLKGIGPATTSALAAAFKAGPYMSVALMEAAGAKADDYTQSAYLKTVEVLQQRVVTLKAAAQDQGLSDLAWLTAHGLEQCIFAASVLGGVDDATQKLVAVSGDGGTTSTDQHRSAVDTIKHEDTTDLDAADVKAEKGKQEGSGRGARRKRTGSQLLATTTKK